MNNKIAFVLQGGGALGAYQAGACQALIEQNIHPDWLVGISIGALNTAIIAGNKPENRIQALAEFWKTISSEDSVVEQIQHINPFMLDSVRKMFSSIDTQNTILKGQSGFFKPKKTHFSLVGKMLNHDMEELSYYDTSPLKETLLKFVDFDLINSGNIRISLGVVKVESGEFLYFDNTKEILTPEHFMASGALPPGFPAIKINDEFYWDGGIANNSAIDKLLEENLKESWTAYQIDLWRNEYDLPKNFDQLTQRLRDIQFSSKNKVVDNNILQKRKQKADLKLLLQSVPENIRQSDYYQNLFNLSQEGDINIKRIVYQGMNHETKERPYQFGITTIKEHWENGYHDMNDNHFQHTEVNEKNNKIKL